MWQLTCRAHVYYCADEEFAQQAAAADRAKPRAG
jgi:hypothetical protein